MATHKPLEINTQETTISVLVLFPYRIAMYFECCNLKRHRTSLNYYFSILSFFLFCRWALYDAAQFVRYCCVC